MTTAKKPALLKTLRLLGPASRGTWLVNLVNFADGIAYFGMLALMTLYMELYDGATQDIIARVIDPEAMDDGMIQWSNSVSNRAEADRILRRWAKLLNEHLAEVQSVKR